jgi:hypothetical protein
MLASDPAQPNGAKLTKDILCGCFVPWAAGTSFADALTQLRPVSVDSLSRRIQPFLPFGSDRHSSFHHGSDF